MTSLAGDWVLVVFSFAEGHIIGNLIAAEVDQNLVDHEWLSREMGRHDMAVIDVRSPDRYAAGHIPSAVNVPVDDTPKQANELCRST